MIRPGLRDGLRLAATVAVVNGFTQVTGLPFAYYASLAVLSVSVGTYGNTLELGRQRLIGTTVGAIVVEGIIKHSVHGLQGQVLNALLHKAAIAAGITCSRAGAQPPRAHELVDAMEK